MSLVGSPVAPPEPATVDSLFAPASRRVAAPVGHTGDAAAKGTAAAPGTWPEGRSSPAPPRPSAATAGELSERYRCSHRLEAADRLVDGFCDLAGGGVTVDVGGDERLATAVTKAGQKVQKSSDPVTAVLALGLFVSEIGGRSGGHAGDLRERHGRRMAEHRSAQGRVMLGDLLSGQTKATKKITGACLCGQRAMVFKLLAAACLKGTSTECTLERDPDDPGVAWNCLRMGGDQYTVDLVHDPGALYEVGTGKQQEYLRLLSHGFGDLACTLSTQKELTGKVPRASWHVDVGDIDYGRGNGDRLGKGGFGEVFRGTWAGSTVAVKVVKDIDPTDGDVLDFVLEISLLSRLSHPNVMRLWRGCAVVSSGRRSLLMVTEYVDRGGLSGILHGHGGPRLKAELGAGQIIALALGIARGTHYLHACNVLHLDLKSPNVLLDAAWTPKLCDFGLAKVSMQIKDGGGLQTTLRGVSPIWAPPEMFDDCSDAMSDKSDVYSFGVVFFELANRALPFQEIGQRQLARAKFEGTLPAMPSCMPKDFAALVSTCLAHRPAARPSMGGVVARILGFAKDRNVEFLELEMPPWPQDGADCAAEAETCRELVLRLEKAKQTKAELMQKVERVRGERRNILQDATLGDSGGIAEEGILPRLSSSPRAAGAGKLLSEDAATEHAQTPPPPKQLCCALQ